MNNDRTTNLGNLLISAVFDGIAAPTIGLPIGLALAIPGEHLFGRGGAVTALLIGIFVGSRIWERMKKWRNRRPSHVFAKRMLTCGIVCTSGSMTAVGLWCVVSSMVLPENWVVVTAVFIFVGSVKLLGWCWEKWWWENL